MTASGMYLDYLPTDKDRLRAIIGDTDPTKFRFSDAHINAVLIAQGSLNAAALFLVDELIAYYSTMPTSEEDATVKKDYGDRADRLRSLRTTLAERVAASAGAGISFVDANYRGTSDADEYSR